MKKQIMTVEEALVWVTQNTTKEALHRLRSRQVAKVLSDEVLRLMRGEYICRKCGLRKDSEHDGKPDF